MTLDEKVTLVGWLCNLGFDLIFESLKKGPCGPNLLARYVSKPSSIKAEKER